MSEVEEIKKRYARRAGSVPAGDRVFSGYMLREREMIYENEIRRKFGEPSGISVLEIGAGAGTNIGFFLRLGIAPQNLAANELLEERVKELASNYPGIAVFPGDALNLDERRRYDVVFQSTVFTSVLDESYREALAGKMMRLVKPGGMILWYDFIFDNPQNKDVRKVTIPEIRKLFRNAGNFRFKRTTLAPPIGRRVGKWYPFFNMFPFLRTHVIAAIDV